METPAVYLNAVEDDAAAAEFIHCERKRGGPVSFFTNIRSNDRARR
jgi:hypothetical protein